MIAARPILPINRVADLVGLIQQRVSGWNPAADGDGDAAYARRELGSDQGNDLYVPCAADLRLHQLERLGASRVPFGGQAIVSSISSLGDQPSVAFTRLLSSISVCFSGGAEPGGLPLLV